MNIYCQKCQKIVGKIADEKVPANRAATVTCPLCGSKIRLNNKDGAEPPKPKNAPSSSEKPQDQPNLARQECGEEQRTGPDKSSADAAGGICGFSIMAIIREAWQKISGIKGTVWGAIGLFWLIMLGIGLAIRFITAILNAGEALTMAMNLTANFAAAPLTAGIIMIAVRRAVDKPIRAFMVFDYFSRLLPLVITTFLIWVLTFMGFLLLIIPGIYLSIGYSLALPLVLDKGLRPWQAMETSRKAIHKQWFKVFGLYLVLMLICLISIIPLGLGLIWTIPMFILTSGILYREVFGVTSA